MIPPNPESLKKRLKPILLKLKLKLAKTVLYHNTLKT